jgi:polyisoprenyl-teichoic acid--peptidoglycan teichoic acid transferase
MRKKSRKFKKQPVVPDQNGPYELYRSLPNPSYSGNMPGGPVVRHVQPPKRGFKYKFKKAMLTLAIAIGILLVGAGGYLGYKFWRDFGWSNIASLFDRTRLKGEDVGRVNILLAGDSADDPGHAGADLTDSIMLVSIDTKTNKAYMLSIPRDLYVNIPGYGYGKINQAYEDGQSGHFSAAGYPNGGMGLLEETVSQKFNVPIDYYALIDYTAFRDAVNAVGGIRIDIQSPDPRGLYDPNTHVDLPNGWVSLDGTEALNLARARGDGYGSYGFPQADFDRTMHQRQMLVALTHKATSLGVLSNPIKVGDLFDAYGKNVQTDFKLNELRRLNTIMSKIPQSRIASAALNSANVNGQKGVDLLQSYETYNGEDALIPAAGLNDYSQIDAYVAQLETQN